MITKRIVQSFCFPLHLTAVIFRHNISSSSISSRQQQSFQLSQKPAWQLGNHRNSMPSKASKRVRKHKETQSLKGKQQAQQQNWQDLLADELQEADGLLDGGDGSNALILPATKAPGTSASAAATAQQQQPLSKSQLKKLKQVQLKKERREQLSQVLTQLNSSSLPEEQLGLLRPLHQRGAKETKKQRLCRALKLQRAGLTDFEGAQELLQPRKVRGLGSRAAAGADSSSSDGGDGSSSDGSDSEDGGHQEQQQQGAAAAAGAAAQQQDVSSASDTDEELERPAKQAKLAAGAAGQQQQQPQKKEEEVVDAAAAQQARLAALHADAKALKALARAEAEAEGAAAPDEDEAEEAAAARQAAVERAAAAAAGPTRVVHLNRPPEMQEARQQLPIIGLEQEVMEGINMHDVVVLCGETGCGKTTQVPQFLLEAGYGCPDFPERSGAICVTQPRRVAAISTAERVAAELGCKLGTTVGYQVRHDRRVGASSAVRFLTDGVLMRQLQSDFLLRTYSIILLDEAHERSLNTDLLLGMLSRLVPLRRKLHEQWKAAGCPPANSNNTNSSACSGPIHPLKLVIMSATLRTSDFTENKRLFSVSPPVLSVPARQFPVTVHFAKHTELQDYLGSAVRKVCRIHRELPAGGILLFLTGQREVQVAVRRIRQAFAKKGPRGGKGGRAAQTAAAAAAAAAGASGGADGSMQDGEDSSSAAEAAAAGDDADDGAAAGADAAEAAADAADALLEADLLDAAAGDAAGAGGLDDYEQLERDEDEEEVLVMGGDGWTPEELAAAEARFEEVYGLKLGASTAAGVSDPNGATGQQQQGQQERGAAPVHVLPLYAMLPQAQQAAVFRPVPAGHRLIVVATNVAETSITIPGIRYVVDAGRSKQKLLESSTAAGGGGDGAVGRYAVDWISKAAAEQRAGRAGRTGPGHVYRLFSSAHFNDNFRQHTDPEIANTPLEGVVLLLKAMGVDKVQNFPFPSPPDPDALQAAIRCLIRLSALQPPVPQPHAAAAAAAVGSGPLTAVGRAMAVFPVTPRHSRMLLQLAIWQQQQEQQQPGASAGRIDVVGGVSAAAAGKALPYAVALAATLSVESPFMHIDALNAETESAAAEAEAAAAADPAAAAEEPSPQHQQQTAEAKAANRKKMSAAAAAHARFRSQHGDALSALNALSAYEAAAAEGSVEDFCADNFLHARHLREMSQLRQQLGRTLLQLQQGLSCGQGLQLPHLPAAVAGGGGVAAEAQQLMQQLLSGQQGEAGQQQLVQPLPPPPAAVLEVLRRALAAGWCDQVARRVRSADYIARLAQEGRLQRHATRYMPACLSEEVFLHPRSCLASSAPEHVVYMSIVRTAKRPYMALVTAVEPQWLADCGSSLCTVSEPLAEPAPLYQPELDRVLAWHDATYSQHDWVLPRLLLPHPDSTTRAAVFAAALLAGKVLPGMAGLSGVLLAPAASVARPELVGLARVGELLQALQSKQVFSRASLAAAWAQDPSFLQPQLALWVHKPQRRALYALWPQLLQEAQQQQQQQQKKGVKRKKKGSRKGGC